MKSLIILGENFVNDQNTYTVSSGDAFKSKIYDQKQSTQWITSGSAEGNIETLQVDFKDRIGDAVDRAIDRLILLNCNLAKFKIEYLSGGVWTSIAEADFTTTPNTTKDVYIEIANPITTQSLLLTATNTLLAEAEKKIGEFKACLFITDLRHRVSFNRRDWDNADSYRLQGGALVSITNVSKVEASVQIIELNLINYELIVDLISNREWMTWVLYEDFRRADIYEFKTSTPLTQNLDRRMQHYTVGFSVKER